MADSRPAATWRTIGFLAVCGLSAIAVTALFWGSPRPTADRGATPLVTTSGSSDPLNSGLSLPAHLSQPAPLGANAAYGISGTAAFVNHSTVILRQLSFIGRGPKVQVELRDSSDQPLAVLKDLSKLTLNAEDVVLAVPSTVDLSKVASLAIVATDYQLVLSTAAW